MSSPIVSTLTKALLLCVFFSNFADSCHTLPEYLDRPINDSITSIKLLLDETRYEISVKRQETFTTLKTMNLGIYHGGPIAELTVVAKNLFTRFINVSDCKTDFLASKAQELMEAANTSVLSELSCDFQPCELQRLKESIAKLLQRIEPEISDLRDACNKKQWDLYNQVSAKLNKLHSTKLSSDEVYRAKLVDISKCGNDYFVRHENEIAYQEDYLLSEIANEMRQIVLQALNEHRETYDS